MTHFSRALPFAFLLVVTGMACSGDDDVHMGGEPRIEIGNGDIGEYDAVEEGQLVRLVRGPQGGQHVWVGIRAWNMDTEPALIQLLVERERDAFIASIPYSVRLRFQDPVPDGETYTQISGLTAVVGDPMDVIGEPCILRARVTENRTGGLSAETSVSVRVEWESSGDGGADGGVDVLDEDGGAGSDGGTATTDGG